MGRGGQLGRELGASELTLVCGFRSSFVVLRKVEHKHRQPRPVDLGKELYLGSLPKGAAIAALAGDADDLRRTPSAQATTTKEQRLTARKC